jgi:predicted aspartyl protease
MRNIIEKTTTIVIIICLILCLSRPGMAEGRKWQRKGVDWQAGSGRRIRAIHYPEDAEPRLRSQRRAKGQARKSGRRSETQGRQASVSPRATGAFPAISALTIDVNSPPVDGFVPWIAVSVTNKSSGELEMEAVPQYSVVGRYPSSINPDEDYIIGLYDTGASAHVMGNASAIGAGIYNGAFISDNESVISGVSGSVTASISYPLGMFIDGLGAVDPDTLLLDRSGMMGQSNVAIMVGQEPVNNKDLPTAIGSPMSVYYTAVFYNDHPITVRRGGEVYTTPDIRIYTPDDPDIPSFPNVIPLELRPLGGISVQYIPDVDLTGGLGGFGDLGGLDDLLGLGGGGASDFPPASPSVIIGNSAQSLFFVHSVDLYDNGRSAIDKDRFMLDTGAQVTVVGSRMAARLRLKPDEFDFEVEIEDVTGTVVMYPGFYIDSIEIPALGDWVSFTNVPVVLLDVSSPEGGTLDGIIGMNLFTEFNLILRGGGLSLEGDPSLEFEPIALPAGE